MVLKRRDSKTSQVARANRVRKTTDKSRSGKSQGQKASGAQIGSPKVVTVNRAPVLVLWMSECLLRLGYGEGAALTVAKVIAARCAIAKGRALGIVSPAPASASSSSGGRVRKRPASAAQMEEGHADCQIAGHTVRLIYTAEGPRAFDAKGGAADPARVEASLRAAFKQDLGAVRATMQETAASYKIPELQRQAMTLYERFRPAWRGWGVKAELHLADIQAAAKS